MKQKLLFEDENKEKPINVASVPMRSPFRYAGGKTWFIPYIRKWLKPYEGEVEFIEPFAGGGIVSLTVAFENLAHTIFMVEKDEAVAYYKPEKHLAGFPGILHGGIQATLLDEIAFWVMFGLYKKMGFTTNMEVQYKRPLSMDNKVELRGEIVEKTEKFVKIKCWLLNSKNKICTEAFVEYVIVNKKLWMRNMGIETVPESFDDYFNLS